LLAARAGVNVPRAQNGAHQVDRAPAQGRGTGRRDQRFSRFLAISSTSPTRSRPSAETSSSPASYSCRRSPTTRAIRGRLLKDQGLTKKALDAAIEAVAWRRWAWIRREAEGQREALKKIHHRSHRARARHGKLDPVIGARRRNSSHDSDPAAANQEQPGADR